MFSISRRAFAIITAGILFAPGAFAADKPARIAIDWATYNPVSMVLKNKGLLEKEFAKDGIDVPHPVDHMLTISGGRQADRTSISME